jgi:hypothetical protein
MSRRAERTYRLAVLAIDLSIATAVIALLFTH